MMISNFPQQKTLVQASAPLSGIGLHSGVVSTVRLRPAEENTGVIFIRKDVAETIHLAAENTKGIDLCTVLCNPEAPEKGVQTVEHLLSALCGLGVTNVVVEVEGPEIPILDGSALPWTQAIHSAGIQTQKQDAKLLMVQEKMTLQEGRSILHAAPYSGLKVTIENGFPGLTCAQGPLQIELTPETYQKEIAPARTFCLEKDILGLQKQGGNLLKSFDYFAQNPDKSCTTMFNEKEEVVLGGPLRFADEPLRHKILDFLGDMFVEGQQIQGDFTLSYPRHSLNSQFLAQLKQQQKELLPL